MYYPSFDSLPFLLSVYAVDSIEKKNAKIELLTYFGKCKFSLGTILAER